MGTALVACRPRPGCRNGSSFQNGAHPWTTHTFDRRNTHILHPPGRCPSHRHTRQMRINRIIKGDADAPARPPGDSSTHMANSTQLRDNSVALRPILIAIDHHPAGRKVADTQRRWRWAAIKADHRLKEHAVARFLALVGSLRRPAVVHV